MNVKIWKIHQVNSYIKSLINSDMILSGLFVEGEISNFKAHNSGHFYFSLKDESSVINCIMFKNYADTIAFMPENGMKAIVYGNVSLYEKTGQYQVYAEMIQPVGLGGLYLSYNQLKEQLYKEGLFEPSRKKPIPDNPKSIAVITSKTGAAVRDIINVIKRRNNQVKVIISDTPVQGETAPDSIVRAISMVNKHTKADIIILGRGGGSTEDLWAFNSEKVARAVAKSRIPIISAIGHETDTTITDYVSDLYAPTPSAAAELAVRDTNEFMRSIQMYESVINSLVIERIQDARDELALIDSTLSRAIKDKLTAAKTELVNLERVLENVSPLKTMLRGYTVIKKDGEAIKSGKELKDGDHVDIHFHDTIKNAVIRNSIQN